jgi:hypothetical protein
MTTDTVATLDAKLTEARKSFLKATSDLERRHRMKPIDALLDARLELTTSVTAHAPNEQSHP